MNGNWFKLTPNERLNVITSADAGWCDAGDGIDFVSCLLECALELLL